MSCLLHFSLVYNDLRKLACEKMQHIFLHGILAVLILQEAFAAYFLVEILDQHQPRPFLKPTSQNVADSVPLSGKRSLKSAANGQRSLLLSDTARSKFIKGSRALMDEEQRKHLEENYDYYFG